MLKRTFLHVPGVGRTIEQRLWMSGIECWDDYLRRKTPLRPTGHLRLLDGHIERSRDALGRRDAAYFEKLLPGAEHWRFYREFSDRVAFLDIETTGLGGGNDCIT
ncbi:MAG: exonuclease, partial [Chloroflexi bacterium]|nr:exonuclease [Chloroflexota bacterium]